MRAMEARALALHALGIADPSAKAEAAAALARMPAESVDPLAALATREPIPGRPPRPRLVAHTQLKPPPLSTRAGVAALVHSIAHIEFNAINLALDICWRFSGMPVAFYVDWLRIAAEEARHFTLLREHLLTLGFDYGDFDAHNALWDMAERTRHDQIGRASCRERVLRLV